MTLSDAVCAFLLIVAGLLLWAFILSFVDDLIRNGW